MSLLLSVIYSTVRKDPKLTWFLDSIYQQIGPEIHNVEFIIVDHYAEEEGRLAKLLAGGMVCPKHLKHVPTKPNVWNGKYKITKEDFFAASTTRNTGLCLASCDWVCFADDLSVAMPGWFQSVREAIGKNKITLGSYKKVKSLKVEKGIATSFEEFPHGIDSRWGNGRSDKVVTAAGGWMFGCSLVSPIEALLTIGGWPEALCDSLGSEDYIAGIMMEKAGYEFLYDRRMLTLESEELHYVDKSFKRMDKGVSPKDKSHAVLEIAMGGLRFHPNYFGDEGIRKLRKRVLAGEPFPILQCPDRDWYDKQLLSEM